MKPHQRGAGSVNNRKGKIRETRGVEIMKTGKMRRIVLAALVVLGLCGIVSATTPIAHWEFDEGAGTDAYDSIGTNDGIFVGDPCWVAGKIGNYALDFDGDDDYIYVGDPVDGSLDFGESDSFSISAWIKTSQEITTTTEVIVNKRRWVDYPVYGIYKEGYAVGIYQSKLSFGVEDSSDNSTGIHGQTVIDDGEWHHIVAIRDKTSDKLYLYVDGLLDASPVTDGTIGSLETSWDLNIGRYKAAQPGPEYQHFPGSIDDVRIYDVALDSNEIETLYEAGLPEIPSTTYHVDGATGDNGNDGLSRETAFATIQYGIDEANDLDTVLVWPGVYVESVYFIDKAITVKAAADAPILEAASNNAVSFYTSEGQETVLANFVIRDSDTGIFVSTGTPTIRNITLAGNGLGIEAENGAVPDIRNCIFWNNTYGDLWNCTAQYSFVGEDFDANLVSYWKLDGDAVDSAGGNDGTIYGAIPTTGQINEALSFDGSNDYINCGNNTSLNIDKITISAWINSNVLSGSGSRNKVIVTKFQDNLLPNEVAFDFVQGKGDYSKLGFGFKDGTWHSWSTVNSVMVGGWMHVVVTYDGLSNPVFYVNGGIEANNGGGVPAGLPTNTTDLTIGAQDATNPSGYFDGTIDDVRIYDRALSAEEIEQMYSVGLAGGEYPDPLFADANNGDYHLLSERGRYWPMYDVWVLDDVTSPCVDGGDSHVKPAAERSPNGGRINIGAFGNTGYASMSEWPFAGDLNLDGIVNLADFAILAQGWLEGLPWAE